MNQSAAYRIPQTLRILTLVLMIGCFILGCVIFDDYGCGPDEGIERQTSLVNFRYTIERLQLPVPDSWTRFLSYLPDLKEYRDRYYGTALHQPLVLIEAFADFELPPVVFYRLRHFYVFLNWYAATIAFYLLLEKRFRSALPALVGWLILVLTPRFFAESFYNNKDILFAAWTIFSLYAIDRWTERETIASALIAGLILALTVNTRLNGLAYYAIAVCFAFVSVLTDRKNAKAAALQIGVLTLSFLLVLILITPNLWEAPFRTFAETFQFSADHPNHSADGNLYFGNLVDASKSKSYLIVWILLTTPTIYLGLALIGGVFFVKEMVRHRLILNQFEGNYRRDALVLSVGLAPLLYIILRQVTVYNTWRHCYFAYPTIVYFAAISFSKIEKGIRSLRRQKLRRATAFAAAFALAAVLGNNIAWIARNHPYQFAYFAPIVRARAESFSGDYWGIATRQLLEAIVTRDPSPWIQVNHLYTQTGSINRGNLADPDRARLDLSYEISDDTDYILFSRDEKTLDLEAFPGFEVWHEIRVDGALVGAVLKRE